MPPKDGGREGRKGRREGGKEEEVCTGGDFSRGFSRMRLPRPSLPPSLPSSLPPSPRSCTTFLYPLAWRKALARSHRTPPVQYMRT